MKEQDMREHETREVKKKLTNGGFEIPMYVIEAVIEAYNEYIEETIPDIDGEELNRFILDEMAFEVGGGKITPELLDKISNAHMDFLAAKGIIPEDWSEDNEE